MLADDKGHQNYKDFIRKITFQTLKPLRHVEALLEEDSFCLLAANYLLHRRRRRQQQAVNPSLPPLPMEMAIRNYNYRNDAV
ncbi:hypothetical protein BV898_00347 [Hypsibius exemplaris]|uniref:Uncharacterized protein n=1 Tax=Hypsibius exemplaris TaxID=2072580 RepID=A0A1W0XFG7_HYPEX|nr:hypothetical protein BV898_00347 [Hypsibius exemplaris]